MGERRRLRVGHSWHEATTRWLAVSNGTGEGTSMVPLTMVGGRRKAGGEPARAAATSSFVMEAG